MNAALEATTKGDDIFQMVNSFFKQHGLKWENLRGCTTDRAPAMLGRNSGFRARVMEVAPHVKFLHCMIHRFALSCKILPAEFFDVLSLVINTLSAACISRAHTGWCRPFLCAVFQCVYFVCVNLLVLVPTRKASKIDILLFLEENYTHRT